MFQTQTDAFENIDIGNIDLVALNSCLEKGLRLLKTECNGWPEMNSYVEKTQKDINDDKTIKVLLRQHPSFGTVITCSFSNIFLCKRLHLLYFNNIFIPLVLNILINIK